MRRTTKILFLLFLILLLLGGFFGFGENILAASPTIIINEIQISGGTGKTTQEFIELYNPTDFEINLKSLPLELHIVSSADSDNSKILTFIDETISTKGYFLIASRNYTENADNTGIANATYSLTSENSLVSNGAFYISTSKDAKKDIIDFIGFGTNDYFNSNVIINPNGKTSIERVRYNENNWQESYILGGTPGYENFTGDDKEPPPPPPVVYSDKIRINEIFPDPTESPENEHEFIELYNFGNQPIDLATWKLKNKNAEYILDKTILPGEYLYFYKILTLHNDGDEIILENPNKELVSSISYDQESIIPGSTYGFLKDDNWKWTSQSTPGLENAFNEDLPPVIPPKNSDYAGKLKINEIFPAPKDKNAGKEFVEIINISSENINLSGMRIEDEKSHKVYFPEKILAPGEITYLEGNFELNNTTPDTAFLIGKDGTKENPIDSVNYTNPKYDYAYAFNGSAWQWTSRETKGAENQFDELLSGQIKKDKTIYAGIYADFEVKTDAKAEHFTWNFGDGHKSYLKKTRHKYEDSGIYLASLKLTGEGKDNLLNFEIEVIEYPAPKIKIVKIKANPKGKDTESEEIYLKNNSKKKVNLKTWSLATGDKNLYNHPITKDFIIQPGKTKKITRKYSLFTLNNKKGAIELRYPNGEVASRVKYDKKKESVKDDEVYELSGKKWQWSAPAEEIPSGEVNLPEGSSAPEENSENINPETDLEISDEEISLNLGRYSSSENKIALAEIKFKSIGENILQSRENPGIVLGAFSARDKIHTPVEIKSVNHWQKTLQKSNQLFNLLLNHAVRLI